MQVLNEFLAALEQLPLSTLLRGSVWLYPLVNAAHIVGIALLFGAIVPLDLRLMGAWKSVPLRTLAGVLLPVAITGLTAAVVAGALLFMTDARAYAGSPWFQMKLGVIALAVTNALALRLVPAWRDHGGSGPPMGVRLRFAGAASIGLWLGAILLGRLVGYF